CHRSCLSYICFQAEGGIRDRNVTGVQTCALPIWHKVIAPQGGPGKQLDTCQSISTDRPIKEEEDEVLNEFEMPRLVDCNQPVKENGRAACRGGGEEGGGREWGRKRRRETGNERCM